ncbi:MAG: flagellar protein FliT [Proteobacteria bacterium]|nr:flagellar protein FliT [Pseudomonadota bacterium]
MSPCLRELLSQLETTWPDIEDANPDQLGRTLQRRQQILTSLRQTDTSSLDQATRDRVRHCLAYAMEQDKHLLNALQLRMAELSGHLSRLVDARSTVRGYGSTEPPAPHLGRWVG